jgi:HAD superfamily hydrolase (TIGR01450 family)
VKFKDFQAVLFDMDGTLYREGHALPGVAELFAHLKRDGIPIRCVTNNGANTGEELSNKLKKMGVDVPPPLIYSACDSQAAWIRAQAHALGRKARVFNFAGSAILEQMAGEVVWVDTLDTPCDVVAVGTHFRENHVPFDFERSLVALNHLFRGAKMVVGCADRVFPIAGGQLEFGSGSWGKLFTFAANLPHDKVAYTGKPERYFFQPLCDQLNLDPKRCIIVGDNLDSDIQGGINMGMKTALLMTGVTSPADLEKSKVKPDMVFEGLPGFMQHFGS